MGVFRVERWFGGYAVVNILIIPAVAITLVDQGLQVQRDIGIGGAQWNPDNRQALSQGRTMLSSNAALRTRVKEVLCDTECRAALNAIATELRSVFDKDGAFSARDQHEARTAAE